MKKRVLILIASWIVEVFAFHRWFSCWLFQSDFYFTLQTANTSLLNAIGDEKGMPIFFIRSLHNKVFALSWGVMQTLLQYWDIRFLIEFVGLIGAIGIGLGIWHLLAKKRKNIFVWVLVGGALLLEFAELFVVPHFSFGQRILPLAVVLQALSLFGIWQFLASGSSRRMLFVVAVLIFSVLMLIFSPLSYQMFCLHI